MKTNIRIAALLLAVLFICLFTACGAKEPAKVDLTAVKEAVFAAGKFPEMTVRPPEMVYDFYGIDPETCPQLFDYVTEDGLLAEELLLLEAKDEALAKQYAASLKDQLAVLADNYRDYMPEEYSKFTSAVVKQTGKYVIMIVSDDAQALYSEAAKLLK